ncbi:MAG TPA: hypothetical protein VJ784_09695 [Pyrinomonadaceae bacterium]|nr:hypothetical protein [Pyrinomonadaceae bacterium]
MTLFMYVVITILVTTGLFLGIRYFVRAYLRYRDSRIIICPENDVAAVVQVDAVHAALTSALGQPDVRLENCARWPLHQSCGQECLVQLDVAPEECLIRGVMMRWYRSKSCVYCEKPFEQVQLLDHKPALKNPEGQLLTWQELAGKDLLTFLATLEPVCWDCYIAHSFVEEHPDLVTYRPWREGIHRSQL